VRREESKLLDPRVLRRRIEVLARQRQLAWEALAGANGNQPLIAEHAQLLTRLLRDEWEQLRVAKAAA
jgi:hypothetical protein